MDFFSEYQTGSIDLGLSFYGYEDCQPAYSFGPAIRDTYILHYIKQGRGQFHYKGRIMDLQAGDFFLLKPNELTFYQADRQEPWSYYWLGISGSRAFDFFSQSQIEDDCYLLAGKDAGSDSAGKIIENLVHFAEQTKSSQLAQLHIMGQLYELMFCLGSIAPKPDSSKLSPSRQLYLSCKQIIDTQYPLPQLSIQEIATELSVHRSYLTTIFKEQHQSSPKEYLHHVRMHRAKQLLENTRQPIQFIAYSVGFSDPLYFSKAFKKFFSCSPSQMRGKEKAAENKPLC
ncbi:MSM (multiple sugar metabolism) operon regulatory protein [Streptococcus sp. DD11]|uniref:AraC family transcriptional regulator n=1 Tax=Streptococcus sp. DD11 TaxID=1777879 RepID=UPI000793340F|nr:AraC family transcriptional regulator [Streptococcus sp. DD11]KXT79779.1 MSM (multiple sugar metabolism) operon regulatory protein [Streptococcus sp. DD11]